MIFVDDMRAFLDSGPLRKRYGGQLEGAKFWAKVPIMIIFNPGILAVGLFRLSSWFEPRGRAGRYLALACFRFNELVTGAQVPPMARIGPGLQILHPQAVVIAGTVVAGRNLVVAGAAVTFGWSDIDGDPENQIIEIGDNVVVAGGAKILGPIKIGSNVKVGPNAMPLEDVPDNSTVVSVGRTKIFSLAEDPEG